MKHGFRVGMLLLLLSGLASAGEPLPGIRLPAGFKLEIWAEDVPNARVMVRGAQGTLFVSSRGEGKVYALRDSDGDGRPDKRYVLAQKLESPNGIAFRDGDLYVAEIGRLWKLPKIETQLDAPPKPVMIRDDLPKETHHGWRYIDFGPDGKLYLAIGAPCNVCKTEVFKRDGRELEYGSITRMDADGCNWERVARGVRNTVGFTWQPGGGPLWFTENGRDWLGDDLPSCELNRLSRADEHFGFPYCHQGDASDPEFGSAKACDLYTAPVAKLGAHVAPLGLIFYSGAQFPAEYRGNLLIAEHGSWNRTQKTGYRIKRVRLDAAGRVSAQEIFAQGWLSGDKVHGRPAYLLQLPDGSILISDDQAGRIYRVSYQA